MTELSPEESRRLPRYPVLPATLIGRLAVSEGFRGKGLGSSFLVDALLRSLRSEPAIFALLVDAKEEAAAQFDLHHGFRPFVSRPPSLFLPVATERVLQVAPSPGALRAPTSPAQRER